MIGVAWPDDDVEPDNEGRPTDSELPAILRYRGPSTFVFAAMAAGMNALAAGAAYTRAYDAGWGRPYLVVGMVIAALLGPITAVLMYRQAKTWNLRRDERFGAAAFASGFVALVVLIVVSGAVSS